MLVIPAPSGDPHSGLPGELPPGSALPSDAECAARVQRSPWEPRPGNYQANHTVPPVPFPNKTVSWSSRRADELKKRWSGRWLDDGGQAYVERIQSNMRTKPYLTWPSPAGGSPPS